MIQRFTQWYGTRWLTLWMNYKAEVRKKGIAYYLKLNKKRANIVTSGLAYSKLRVKGGNKLLSYLRSKIDVVSQHENDYMLIKNADQEILQMEGMLGKLQAINEVISTEQPLSEFKIDCVINSILNDLQEQIISRNVFVRIYAENGIKLVSKPKLIRLILENLIENAIKYSNMSNCQSYVEISIHKDNNNFRFIIEDNGIGIRKQSFDKIFNLFYKDVTKAEGAGLGLYIVREALQKLNGSIGLDSEEGCFTKVEVQIPNSDIQKKKAPLYNNTQSISHENIQSV
ncbi:signal transduction histidine kinase [Catalinimonas alkaloidigena]|uniref:sensor histidine kinase n=1 Tax=Catalinimonas alkaloidigena TaxID=1075417 RepID=UPI0024072312|nr:ATP-binding protein [Catalinimonas alkaloidigena]MDF9796799.1 signal transduction histidine kinase [Catalinimonas alkaloidigena]